MDSRERIFRAINREKLDRIPMNYVAEPEVTEMLKKHFRVSEDEEVWKKLHVDKIALVYPIYARMRRDIGNGQRENFWGIRFRPVTNDYGTYWEICHNPLATAETMEDFMKYRWPTPDVVEIGYVSELCRKYSKYVLEIGNFGPFYEYMNLRTMEKVMLDLALYPDIAHYAIGKITEFDVGLMARICEANPGKIDLVIMADDFGSQRGLLISKEMWRTFFQKPLRRIAETARHFGAKIFHHDDGAIRELLPELIEVGIDILDPVQWRCPGMDRAELKREFGDRICFHGAMDNQHTLPFGTPQDVSAEVSDNIRLLGAGGTGFILGPCHALQANTPLENILAMYETGYAGGKI